MIYFGNMEHARQIAAAIPRSFNIASDAVLSRTDADGRLLGGVTFDGYTGNCIFVHQAGFAKNWLSRDLLFTIFDFAFNHLGVEKVAGTVPSHNAILVALNIRLGFREEARIKDAYKTGDMLVMTMTRAECPWLKPRPSAEQHTRDAP